MSNYGKAVVILGLIGMAGAVDTGYGWFASGVLLGIGTTFLIAERSKKIHKRKRALIERQPISRQCNHKPFYRIHMYYSIVFRGKERDL